MKETQKFPFVAWTVKSAKACTEKPCWEPCKPAEQRWRPYAFAPLKIKGENRYVEHIRLAGSPSKDVCLDHCQKALQQGIVKSRNITGYTVCEYGCRGAPGKPKSTPGQCSLYSNIRLQHKTSKKALTCPSMSSIMLEVDIKDAVASPSEVKEVQRLLSMNPNKGNLSHIVQCEKSVMSVNAKGCMLTSTNAYSMLSATGHALDNSGFINKKDITRAAYFGDLRVPQPKDFGKKKGSFIMKSDYPYFFQQSNLNSQFGLYFSTCDNGWTAPNVAYVCKRGA